MSQIAMTSWKFLLNIFDVLKKHNKSKKESLQNNTTGKN